MKYLNLLLVILSIATVTQAWNEHQTEKPIVTTSIVSQTNLKPTIITAPPAIVPELLPIKQRQILTFAYQTAKQDGINQPAFLQGILMQESSVCNARHFRVSGLTNKPDDRYFGCGQIKLAAAQAVMRQFPSMWKYLETRTNEELKARLILDDRFNVRVTSKYILMMGINEDPDRAITAYNVGLGAVDKIDTDTFGYTNSVKNFSEKMKIPKLSKKNIQT
jgi:hypothetical protein